MLFAILSIIGASDSDMGILLNVQKQTIYHRRQIVRKHVNPDIDDIDAWLRAYVLQAWVAAFADDEKRLFADVGRERYIA